MAFALLPFEIQASLAKIAPVQGPRTLRYTLSFEFGARNS
jgi:hypothetical protein